MATISSLQDQIFEREGFKVTFERLSNAKLTIPDYKYPVMAPSTWKVSDWKTVRLAAYVMLFKSVTVYRGDGSVLRTDVRLSHLRDSYYVAVYGDTDTTTSIVPMRRSKGKK
jgi:hypothetical protein